MRNHFYTEKLGSWKNFITLFPVFWPNPVQFHHVFRTYSLFMIRNKITFYQPLTSLLLKLFNDNNRPLLFSDQVVSGAEERCRVGAAAVQRARGTSTSFVFIEKLVTAATETQIYWLKSKKTEPRCGFCFTAHLSFSLLNVVSFISGVSRLQANRVLLKLPHLKTKRFQRWEHPISFYIKCFNSQFLYKQKKNTLLLS